MSYNLRAYWEEPNHNNVVDRLEIKELNYSGSTIELKAQGFDFNHREITTDSNDGYLNPTFNKILMGVLNFKVWGHDTNSKQLIEDIKTANAKQFLVEWSQGSQKMWFGFASGRILMHPESEKYVSTLQFKDFDCLKSQEFTLDDTRQTIITTILGILDSIGHSFSTSFSGYVVRSRTSWQAQGTDGNDDFLNQVYHDTKQLRQYGRLGDEVDTAISQFDALKFTCAPQLLIYQIYGRFQIVQLSAFDDPENVLLADYRLNGTQATPITTDFTQDAFDTISDGTPIVLQNTINTSFPAIQKASFEYDHKSLNANITVPETVTITSAGEQKFSMNVRLTGDESIIFTTRNVSRMTIPFSHYTTFTDSDVDVNNDEIEITPSLSIDQKVRLKATAGTVPGGLSEGVDYYMKPKLSDEYGFDTFPYRINNDIDITSDGGSGAVSRVLTIEELTIKNAEFALTLGNTFLDTGTGTFILPGKTYTGMATTLINFTAGDVNTITDTFEILGHGLKDGQLIIFTNAGGSLPGGIDEDEYYYVVNRTIDTYQVSESYGGSVISLTSTGTGAHTCQRASMVRGLSDTSKLAEYVGDFSFELNELITNQTVELNLHLFPSRTLQVDNMDDEFLDETNWLDTVVQFIDPSNTSSTSIVYELEQDSANATEVLTLPSVRFGDGPFDYSRSAYRTSTDLEDLTDNWRRRGQSSYVGFELLLLKEVMDTQRSRPTKLEADIIGNYIPQNVLVYESKNYAYVGGRYSNARWRPTLVEVNLQTGSDTLTELKKVDPSGSGGVIITNPETEGLTESEADSRYLQISNDLSDVNDASTARTNLGLGTGDSPTFNGLTSTGVIITDEIDTTSIVWDALTPEVFWVTSEEKFNNPVFIGTSLDVDNGINADQHIHAGTYLKADTYLEVGTSATIGTTLDVTGATTLSTLDVSGNTALNTLSVTGNTTLSSNLNFSPSSGNAVIDSGANNLEISALKTFINQNTEIDGVLTLLDALNVDGATTLNSTLELNGSADFNSTMNLQGNLTTQADLQDDGYATGWSGTNWQIQADGSAEFEEMRIRGALRVFEFIAKQISTIGGSEILSIAQGRVVSVSAGDDTITVENVTGTPGNSFKTGDLWICQVVDINNDLESGGTGSIVKSVRGTVLSVSGNDVEVGIESGNITQLERGDLIVAYGNTSDADRQAIMYRNVDRSEDSLIMRMQTEITDFSELQDEANTRVAFGDLGPKPGESIGYSGLDSETFGFFAGDNSAEHILVTEDGLSLKDGAITLAELSSGTFKVGDDTNFISFDNTSLDITTNTFSLDTTNIHIDSSTNGGQIKVGSGDEVILGNLSSTERGLSLNSNNFWKFSSLTSGYFFKVGDATNFISFNTGGNLNVKTNTFTLDTTASGGGIDIDSTSQTIKLEDSNKVRTQVDITNGSPSVSVDVNQSISAQTITNLSDYETTPGSYYNVDLGDAVEVFVTASLTTLTNAGGGTFIVYLYGGNSSTSATNELARKRSQIISSGSTSLYVTAYSYTYDYFKVRIEADFDTPGDPPPDPAVTFTTSTFTVKSYESQTRIALDGVYVNNDSTQYARLTRDSNKLSGLTILENLPTGDPKIVGALYNDNGTIKISSG